MDESRAMSDDAYDVDTLLPSSSRHPDVVLIPNRFGENEPAVLVVAHQERTTLYAQLTSTEARQLAASLNTAADEADELGGNAPPVSCEADSPLRHGSAYAGMCE